MNKPNELVVLVLQILLAASCLFVSTPLSSQQTEYQPIQMEPGVVEVEDSLEFHPTKELLAVMISSSWCGGNNVEGFDAAIRGMKNALAARADSLGYSFSAIAVAIDWDLAKGTRYLMEGHSTYGQLDFGPWGEIVVGRRWLNSAASLYALSKDLRWQAVPQVLVLERTVIPHERYVEVTHPRFLFRVSSGDDIVEWAEEQFPVPNLPYDPGRRPSTGEIH